MKKKYDDYSKMPVTDGTENFWFSEYISDLGLETDKQVVLLNKNNAETIRKDIETNLSYNSHFSDKLYEYHVSKTSKEAVMTDEKAILDLVVMIDYENSTNVWRYKKKRDQVLKMVKYIVNPDNFFWTKLRDADVDLVEKLKNASGSTTNGPKSLASKICKYFSRLFFNNNNAYFINDSVVRHVLPYYLHYYGLLSESDRSIDFDSLNYESLNSFLEKISEKLSEKLTKDEIDRIMWYCYRFEKRPFATE